MRLTYYFAAIAATLIEGVVYSIEFAVFEIACLIESGETSGLEFWDFSTPAHAAYRIGASLLVNLVLVGAAWAILGMTVSGFRSKRLSILIVRGVLASGIVSMLMLVILIAFGGVRSLAGLGFGDVFEAAAPVAVAVLAGAAWGAVFWMRAPEPVQAAPA
jgi:hypothetical protein